MSRRLTYERAKPWNQTRAEIDALLQKHLIDDVQWTTAAVRERGVLRFSKHLLDGAYRPPNDKIVAVQIEFSFPLVAAERNRAARHLLWYLKAKLEAVDFKLSDGSRMFGFEREFFAHLIVEDARGETTTMFDAAAGVVENLRGAYLAGDETIALPPARVVS